MAIMKAKMKNKKKKTRAQQCQAQSIFSEVRSSIPPFEIDSQFLSQPQILQEDRNQHLELKVRVSVGFGVEVFIRGNRAKKKRYSLSNSAVNSQVDTSPWHPRCCLAGAAVWRDKAMAEQNSYTSVPPTFCPNCGTVPPVTAFPPPVGEWGAKYTTGQVSEVNLCA